MGGAKVTWAAGKAVRAEQGPGLGRWHWAGLSAVDMATHGRRARL